MKILLEILQKENARTSEFGIFLEYGILPKLCCLCISPFICKIVITPFHKNVSHITLHILNMKYHRKNVSYIYFKLLKIVEFQKTSQLMGAWNETLYYLCLVFFNHVFWFWFEQCWKIHTQKNFFISFVL